PAAIKAAYDTVTRRYATRANIPGFRKGVPPPTDIVRLRYKDEIRNDVLQMVVADAASKAMEDLSVKPISEPQVHIENFDTVKVDGSEPI
ncbi:trigger factor family protein, partial [Escherichia coli]|nr:trigger factor family protein [Escherichia coli]